MNTDPTLRKALSRIDTKFGTYERDDAAHVVFAFEQSREELTALLGRMRARGRILSQHVPTMADLLDDAIERLADVVAQCDDVLAEFDGGRTDPPVPADRSAA